MSTYWTQQQGGSPSEHALLALEVMPTPSDSIVEHVGKANARFLDVYRVAKDHESHQVPVLVVLADKLVLVRRHGRLEESLVSDVFSTIKGVAHIPIALFVTASALQGGRLDDSTAATLSKLEADVVRIESDLSRDDREANDPTPVAALRVVLAGSRGLVSHLLGGREADAATLRAFGRELRAALQHCVSAASALQLSILHDHVNAIVRALDPWEQRALQIVVLGDHQARRRSLPMQYFEKRLAEPAGSEMRLAYGEGITSVEEALALVGTRRLDVAIAETFFGDPARLYRDVLGDAARELLLSSDLASLT